MPQINAKNRRHDWLGKPIQREVDKKLKFDHADKYYKHKSESVPENETHKILLLLKIQTDRPIPAERLDKNKRIHHLADFAGSADNIVKKNFFKIDKYLDLAKEQKMLWNVKMTVIPIVNGALGTVPKDLEKRLEEFEIRGRIETIQTIKLRSAWMLRKVPEIWGDLLSLWNQ